MTFIDLPYFCERQGGTGLLSEPVNVFTNVVFFIVAWLLFQKLKNKKVPKTLHLFVPLSIAIGTGSVLFHIFHNPFTNLIDGLPILITMLLFVFLFMRSVFKSKRMILVILLIFFILQLTLYISGYRNVENVSVRHLINIFAFPLLIIIAFKKFSPQIHLLVFAFISYAVAIALRFLEPAICQAFPIGTHFTWHILNALVIYFGVSFLTNIHKSKPKTI